MNDYLVLDFETSGLSWSNHRIIQVGFCTVVGGDVANQDSWLVNQDCHIDPGAQAKHGITIGDLRARGVPAQDSLAKLLSAMRGAPFCVGHNLHEFDIPFLVAECRRFGMSPPVTEDFVDTAALYKGWKLRMTRSPSESHRRYASRVLSVRAPGLKYSLEACCRDLNISTVEVDLHHASSDAFLTHRVFEALKGKGVA